MIDERPFTFWDEEKQRSEFHWADHVLYGSNEATMELLELLVNFSRYRSWCADSYVDITKRLDAWMDGASRVAEGKEP